MSVSFEQSRPADRISTEVWDMVGELEPAAVSDVLHARGFHDQVMRHGIGPIDTATRLAGIARTMQSQPLVGPPQAGREYELLFAAIDGLQPGEVLVTDRTDCCVWGELCSEAAICRGGNGAVIDGFSRDMELVRKLGFPLFCRGSHMSDLLYHRTITGINEAVCCGDVAVRPGDLLLGSEDGIVVIPGNSIEEVVREAWEKVKTESKVRIALRNGMTAGEAYRKFGVM